MTATDIADSNILEQLRRNVAKNSHLLPAAASITVAPLDFAAHTACALDDEHFDIVLAGDVIYDDMITTSFVSFIKYLVSAAKSPVSVIIATEKRYVFTLAELDTVAPAFDFFMAQLAQLVRWGGQDSGGGERIGLEFLDTDFPQYFCYERSAEMVLLKLSF